MKTSPPAEPLAPDANGVRNLTFAAFGTKCSIRFRLTDEYKSLSFAADALEWIGKFEAKFSRYQPSSLISKINAAAGGDWIAVDAEMEHLLKLADNLHQRTNGILDPTMLPLLRVWDWKTLHQKLPTTSEIKSALQLTGWKKLERRPGAVRLPLAGMGIDFGGFGKEYAVDYLAQMARNSGISDALIDLGRDLFALGGNGSHPSWHIGIEDGQNPGICWNRLSVTNRAVSSSGDYARHFIHQGKRYGHILDPRTGWPVANRMLAATVIAPTCLEAGIYSTAVFVLGIEEGLHLAKLARGVEVSTQNESGIHGTRNFGQYLVNAA
jgi:FAD:protein FMN transferase